MNHVFALIGYFLCGEQPDSIRLEVPDCRPPTQFEQILSERLAHDRIIDMRKNELQRALTEFVNTQSVTIPTLYATAASCDAARAIKQKEADQVDANFKQLFKASDGYMHSGHYKCLEVEVH
jgi:hypothetical protein